MQDKDFNPDKGEYTYRSGDEFLELHDLPEGEELEVSVLDSNGKTIIERVKIKNKKLYVQFLDPGRYTLMIKTNAFSRVGRFVKF